MTQVAYVQNDDDFPPPLPSPPALQRPLRTDSTRPPGQRASVDRQAPCCTRTGHGGPRMLVAYVGPNYQESGHTA